MTAPTPVLPAPRTDSWDWQLRGACRGADDRLFFPPDQSRGRSRARREAAAKALCAVCPVVAACAAHALAVGEPHGVWGGMTPRERDGLRDRALALTG